jgi:formylmethanofuran dehydrogenase subunit E-like metal-binding protein
MRHTIEAIRNEARIVWSVMDDGMKAALRTAYQTVQSATIIALFAVASAGVAWASGADVNLLETIAIGRTAIGAAALAALASLKAYYMNRGDKGARYDVKGGSNL